MRNGGGVAVGHPEPRHDEHPVTVADAKVKTVVILHVRSCACPSSSRCTAVLSTALGGFVALRSRDRLHLVLGFAAGVMLGLVAFDLLPELFELSDTIVPRRPDA